MKYRVFNRDRGCFLDPTYLRMRLTPSGQIIVEGVAGPNILQFSTGMLDESGEEIYEGDVVKGTTLYGESLVGDVRYYSSTAMFKLFFSNGTCEPLCNTNPRILGHIHDGRNWSFV